MVGALKGGKDSCQWHVCRRDVVGWPDGSGGGCGVWPGLSEQAHSHGL